MVAITSFQFQGSCKWEKSYYNEQAMTKDTVTANKKTSQQTIESAEYNKNEGLEHKTKRQGKQLCRFMARQN